MAGKVDFEQMAHAHGKIRQPGTNRIATIKYRHKTQNLPISVVRYTCTLVCTCNSLQ